MLLQAGLESHRFKLKREFGFGDHEPILSSMLSLSLERERHIHRRELGPILFDEYAFHVLTTEKALNSKSVHGHQNRIPS